MNEENQTGPEENKKDLEVVVEVSEDKAEVYLTLVPHSESPEFSIDQIRKALVAKGIKFGIKEEVLAFLEENIKYNQRMLVASGTKPREGKNGTLKYFFETGRKVKKGEKIAEIIPPEPGIDGLTVFEEKIPASQGKKAEIPKLLNVWFPAENKTVLTAQIDGYLFIDQATLRIVPFFELEKDALKDVAYVKVTKPLTEGDFNADDLKRFLKESGIEHGVLEEEIDNIFKQGRFEQRILISQIEKRRQPASGSGEGKKDVDIAIEVSRDEFEAYLTLTPLTESPEFSTGQIRKELAEKEIKVGINEEVLELLDKKVKYNEKLLIASGTKPGEGKDGTIEFLFDCDQTIAVKKDEKIAKIIPPEKGAEGITIFGEKIPAPEPEEAVIPALPAIGVSPQNKYSLIAKTDGYLTIEPSFFDLKPFFELEKPVDDYEARVTVAKPLNKGDFGSEDLKRFLADNGIVYGILDEEIENIFKQEKFEEPVMVAQGQRVLDARDGGVKFYFETEIKPRMDARGNIDYKELNVIQNVQAGDKLAEIFPPDQGREGCTVFGQKIPPKKGMQPVLPKGKNTQPDPNDPNVLLAEIDGSVKLRGQVVDVEPVIVVKQDVDFATGNIDFSGSIFVNGDVKSGFSIKAKENVQVNGVVEDAVIEAGGEVLLKTGFIGRGEGQITATGEVHAKFCENEAITSESDIHISEYAMHSKIKTKGTLFVVDKTGLIVGGEAFAVKGIEAKVVGNENYTPTALFAGVDSQVDEKLKITTARLAKHIENLKNIDKILHKFSRRQLVKKDLPEDKKNLVEKLIQIKKEQEEERKNAAAEIEKLEEKIREFKKALVKVFGVVYPGTTVTIYNRRIAVNKPLKAVYFRYTVDEVVAADLGEAADS